MPGIADSPVAPLQLNSAAYAGDFKVTPGVGDLMKAFKDGFITTEDIAKRALDKPLENAQRSQDLQDTNLIRPKKRETAEKQLDLQSQSLDAQAKALPQAVELSTTEAETALGKAKEALTDFKAGGDPKAYIDTHRQLFPGRALPRKPDGTIDYEGGAEAMETEVTRRKNLEAAKAGAANIETREVKETDPNTGMQVTKAVQYNKVTGLRVSETELSRSPYELNEQQAGSKRYSERMALNEEILGKLEQGGFDPTAAANTVKTYLFNRLQGPQLQDYTAAKDSWISANLRKESGAAISAKEYKDAGSQYFPIDGDSESGVKLKKQRREAAERSMYETIGPSAPVRKKAAAPAAAPADANTPVRVNHPKEAPTTAKFILMPDGNSYINPGYIPTP
jgi:hypothetical protein